MFGSVVLEIAIGLVAVYVLLGLLSSTINEMVAGLLNWRAKNLYSGLNQLLGDEKVVNELLDQPLIKTLKAPSKNDSKSGADSAPDYIPAKRFAQALLGVLAAKSEGKAALNDVEKPLNALPEGALKHSPSGSMCSTNW